MSRSVPRHTLELHGDVYDFLYVRISLILLSHILAKFHGSFYRHAHGLRYHLGDLICSAVRKIQHAADIPNAASGCKSTECDYLRHSILTIFTGNIINNFLASFITEIDVEIRHRYTLAVQESFEHKCVLDGINISNTDRICCERTRTRTSSGTDHNAVGLRKVIR